MEHKKKLKCEIYRDSFQNSKRYAIPKAQLIIADVPYCYDELTECWTTDGWKKYTDLTINDTLMSLNHETQEIEYSGIEKIIIKDKPDEMVRFYTKDIDLLVTKNHRMYALNKRISSHGNIKLAEDVNGAYYLPRSGYSFISHSKMESITIPSCEILSNGNEHIEPALEISLDRWLPFFGLWLADGCTSGGKGSNGRQLYTVSIKQAGDKRKAVAEVLSKLPFKFKEYKEIGNDKSNFNIYSKQLWLYLRQFGKSKDKFIPREILDLPMDYLKLFWQWYTFGDSHKNGNGLSISSVSKRLADGLQEIALKLGTLCQIRKHDHYTWKNPLYEFHFNPQSRNITYGSKEIIKGKGEHVWCVTLKKNSVFLVRRNGKIAFCGNCVGNNFYGSRCDWYIGGENSNGESKLAGKAAFNSDYNFNLYEYFHFCSKMLKKEDKKPSNRGRSSDSPCMIVFCSFEQTHTLIEAAKKHGFIHYIPLVFIKKYSPQVLKANMRVVGATEYALVLYRDKLPKFRNGLQIDENGKNIRGTGKMIFNWFEWKKDGKDIPKIHPSQKPIATLKQLIEIFTDEGDVVIDPCCGSGTTLRAAAELGRSAYGFEIDRNFYERAKNEMLVFKKENQMSIDDFMN
jgi:site-specific DNA-methyltransferase (adenine-specific)